ncbi:MAG: bifunctional UDP-N-acetylglucosamine diphosphorylase/glucosamine-1-phosphate N-acetyltransferase GlmU [Blastocatellales bacterium]|nr:bifunctional UDP-N-acetylglucosamine diphosphorylase/glucosamine-1-phosphate N-acetyltransferase GlmU [Blastocatellales bacterium]
MSEPIHVLILAAGLGTRMKSDLAKVRHRLGGRTLLAHVLRSAAALDPASIIVVVGHQAEAVESDARAALADTPLAGRLRFALQAEQRGTGHAVMSARNEFAGADGSLLVLYGDVPLVRPSTLQRLTDAHTKGGHSATLLTTELDDPHGYGRIIRDAHGQFLRIVEEKDCSPDERAINEINPGFYCFRIAELTAALDRLTTANAQGEYYLTDAPELIARDGGGIGTLLHRDAAELNGINTRAELAAAWKRLRREILDRLMNEGVTIEDPDSTYIDDGVEIGRDTVIHPQVIIEGRSRIGAGCEIHSWSRLVNADIGDECRVLNGCVIVDSRLEGKNSAGPYAHLRMGANLAPEAVVGNFVEVKKSRLGRRTKSMHLTYLGDATLGDRVNIGAGTVTCNYDGKRKHETHIEDDVKIGSDTMLVAPVRVGRGSVSGAGSVIIEDVPPDSLVAGVPARVKKKLKQKAEGAQ